MAGTGTVSTAAIVREGWLQKRGQSVLYSGKVSGTLEWFSSAGGGGVLYCGRGGRPCQLRALRSTAFVPG